MSAYCPEGIGTCADAEAGPCVVGHPCAFHPADHIQIEVLADRWDVRALVAMVQGNTIAAKCWAKAADEIRALKEEL